jgi:hypothetical protein
MIMGCAAEDGENQSGSFQFVMLTPIRITLRASRQHEAVSRLPKALGLERNWGLQAHGAT